MRRLILLLLVLCMHGLARGQTGGYSGYYWFDSQPGKPQTSPVVQGSFDVDASALADGIHTFHYMVIESDTAVSSPIYSYFLKSTNGVSSEQISCFCIVDGNLVHKEVLPPEGGAIHCILDVNGLEEGLHMLQINALMDDGAMSGCYNTYFVRVPNANTIIKGYYWFDDETDVRETAVTNGTFEVDASSLSDGFHRFYYMAMQENGATSVPSTCYFLKTAQVNPDDELTCICSVDGQLRHIEKLSQQGGIIHWNLDMQDLADGVHQISLQAVTPSGAVSTSYNSYFMRVTSTEDLSEMYCVYAIDGNSLNSKSNVVSNSGSFHFDLDLSELEEGLHYISFMLHSDRGTSTKPQTRFFIKTPLGGNVITQYQYWLNEDSIEQATTVKLSEKVSPLQLMTLLPVESRPLRSSLFHLDTSNGTPMIYAKNTIHLRFFDAAMRFSDVAKDYTDFSVGQEVKPVGELQSTQTFPKVAENDIRWYTIEASKGEYLEFKTDKACTIQLFSPSGEEVYHASGYDVLKWGGCHAPQNGVYYFAVHDITAQQGTTISLDYDLISKYAVLHHTPDIVGNAKGSYFTMHMIGNGFDKLVDATLKQGDHIISKNNLMAVSRLKVDIQFHIVSNDCPVGNYDLILMFVDEDGEESTLTVKDAIVIEEAYYADIKVEMVNKSNVRPYPLSVKLKNDGNMSYSYVPLNIAWDNPLQANDVTFKNFYATVAEVNDSAGYQPIVCTNNLLGKGVDGAVMFFYIPELGPHETMELQLGFSAPALSHFNIYAWTGTPFELDTLTLNAQPERGRRKANTSNVGSNILSFGDNLQSVTGSRVMPNTVQAAGNVANSAIKIGVTIGSMQNAMGRSLGRAQIEALGGNWDDYKDIYDGLYPEVYTPGRIWGGDVGDGVDQLMNNQRQCAENSDPDPGSSYHGHIAVPFDPNDIFGYLSEAGSKFIADSVARVNYTIEFENDTTFATAAAHTIVIKDTLDTRYFDLAKFMPTGVRIGERETFLDEADVVTKNNVTSFVKTIDMRPEINVIAQVDGKFSHTTGIAEWRFTSLDPMTMEPTDDLMQGILPVNYNGTSGIGEVMFEVGVKQGKADGTEINNRAGIVFDYEEAILTPTWTNIVDAVAPSSHIDNSWMANDSTLRVTADAYDARSGVWKYEWYVQAGENAPWWKEGETYSNSFDYHIYEGIDYGFCVLVTDSAGNVEQKVIERERGFKTYGPDYEDTIEEVPATAIETEDAYDVSGRKVGRKAKGIIIRHSDGTTRKVLIKE